MKKNTHNSTPADNEDNAFFEKYLQGESLLSDLYQQTESPEPSDTLNQSILSAARSYSEQTKKKTNHWWTQPGSWAASIAIFSLVALLTHETWLAEQTLLEKDFSPAPSVETSQSSERFSDSQAKKFSPHREKNDSRKLLYKSAPAPIMPAASGYMMPGKNSPMDSLSELSESFPRARSIAADDADSAVPTAAQTLAQPTFAQEKEQKKLKAADSEPQLMLDEIQQLMKNNQLDKARALLIQLRTKYPDTPIDPVILQQLSPY